MKRIAKKLAASCCLTFATIAVSGMSPLFAAPSWGSVVAQPVSVENLHVDSNLTTSLLRLASVGSTWVLYILLALSVVSLAVIIERLIFFARQKTNLISFREEINSSLINGNWQKAFDLCKGSCAFEARIGLVAIESRATPTEAAHQIIEGAIAADRRLLDKGLTFLGTLGNNAPFIGLFGTVLGIIDAFRALALNPEGGAQTVMSGISEALVTTAVGLAVAIPAVVAFNTYQRFVKLKIEGATAISGMILGHAARRQHQLQQQQTKTATAAATNP